MSEERSLDGTYVRMRAVRRVMILLLSIGFFLGVAIGVDIGWLIWGR